MHFVLRNIGWEKQTAVSERFEPGKYYIYIYIYIYIFFNFAFYYKCKILGHGDFFPSTDPQSTQSKSVKYLTFSC